MPKQRFAYGQIAFALRQADGGTPAGGICRRMGVREATFRRWKKVHAGMGAAEIRRLEQIEDENGELKRPAADPSLDEEMLRDAPRKRRRGPVARQAFANERREGARAAPSRAGSRPPSASAGAAPSRPAASTARPIAIGRAAIRGRRCGRG